MKRRLSKLKPADIERFWFKVSRASSSQCWEWQEHKNKGYGRMWLQGDTWPAPVISFVIHNGPVPDGKIVCHTCDNRGCVNPAHLYAGTHQTNAIDRKIRGRNNTLKGELSPVCKLSDAEVEELRQAQGTMKQLATRFGISAIQASRIRSGKSRRIKTPSRWRQIA